MRMIILGYLMNINEKKLNSAILKRKSKDKYTCCNCGYHNNVPLIKRDLHGHHTYNKKNYPKLTYNVDYLRTLCEKCHANFHIKFMGGYDKKCTIYNYYVWRMTQELLGASIKKIFYKLF